MVNQEKIQELNHKFEKANPLELLQWLWQNYGKGVVLGTGFGPSGIILIHHLKKAGLTIPIFYLDTGLFFDETYQLKEKIERELDVQFTRVSTDLSLEDQAVQYGSELWRNNPNKCCFLRKILPLQQYLADKEVWITGVRRSQSQARKQTKMFEWDPMNKVMKVNPLVSWTSEDVWSFIKIFKLPYNKLHESGYRSIGCSPCTQPVLPHEDERAGRWAGMNKTECGIHKPTQH